MFRPAKIAALAAMALAARAWGAAVWEPFNYTYTTPPPGTTIDGLTNPSNYQGWYRMGAVTDDEILVAQGSLGITGLSAPMGNSIAYQGFGKTERLSLGAPAVTSGTVYYSLAFQLTGLTGLSTLPNGVFVAGFNNVTPTVGVNNQPTAIGGRLYIKPAATADMFLIGTSKNTSTTAQWVWDTVERPLNTPIFIVGSYTINPGATDNDVAQMWINPDKASFAGAEPAPTLVASVGADLPMVGSFLFRQGIGGVPDVQADELRVDSTWAGVTGVDWVSNLGAWSDAARWSGGTVPDRMGAEVNFPPTPFGSPLPTSINVDSDPTVGSINFTSAERVTIEGRETLTMQSPTGGTLLHRASINAYAGDHLISARVRLFSNTAINVLAGAKLSMTLIGGVDGTRMTKIGAGVLEVRHVEVDDFSISAGTVALAAGLGSSVNSLLIGVAEGATLDMADGEMVIRAGSANVLADISNLIRLGRADGNWTGSGITSSRARDNARGSTGVAAILNDHEGAAVNAAYPQGAVLVKYTFVGDSDLDLDIDGDDYARLDAGYAQGLGGYFNGDFDYSGTIDFDDYFLIDRAFYEQGGTLAQRLEFSQVAVPEPGAVMGLTVSTGLLMMRRYRR